MLWECERMTSLSATKATKCILFPLLSGIAMMKSLSIGVELAVNGGGCVSCDVRLLLCGRTTLLSRESHPVH